MFCALVKTRYSCIAFLYTNLYIRSFFLPEGCKDLHSKLHNQLVLFTSELLLTLSTTYN